MLHLELRGQSMPLGFPVKQLPVPGSKDL